ncbi:putative signal transducing protein [Thalassotalea ganghwensis]
MKMVYTHSNRLIVGNIKNLVESQRIDVFVKNEYAQGAIGEISTLDCWPELWVINDHDYSKAMAVVANANQAKHADQWICNACLELNEPTFELCWNCQHEDEVN